MSQEVRGNKGGKNESHAQSVTPEGYPYSPEGLWQRVLQVIKVLPDELTYRKLGDIFGLEFDEDKILWYGDKESKRYFSLATSDIKNTEMFPFNSISLSQSAPNPANKIRARRMVFGLSLFEIPPYAPLLVEQSEKYCIRPKRSDVEELGYHYDEIASSMPPPTDRHGVEMYRPYFEEIFVADLHKRLGTKNEIILNVLSNGCLVGVRYFNYPKF